MTLSQLDMYWETNKLDNHLKNLDDIVVSFHQICQFQMVVAQSPCTWIIGTERTEIFQFGLRSKISLRLHARLAIFGSVNITEPKC